MITPNPERDEINRKLIGNHTSWLDELPQEDREFAMALADVAAAEVRRIIQSDRDTYRDKVSG